MTKPTSSGDVMWRRGLDILVASTVVCIIVASTAHPSGGQDTVAWVFTFAVVIEKDLRLSPESIQESVAAILKESRGWSRTRLIEFKPAMQPPPDVAIILAKPATVDRLCVPLQTLGRWNCYRQQRIIINARNWLEGNAHWKGFLPEYRTYLINHEVGHFLGLRHRPCPGPGQPAPVMMQQSKGTSGCRRNPWPLPDELTEAVNLRGKQVGSTPGGPAATR